MSAKSTALESRHVSMSLWFVLAFGVLSGMLIGAAGLILAFAMLTGIKSLIVG